MIDQKQSKSSFPSQISSWLNRAEMAEITGKGWREFGLRLSITKNNQLGSVDLYGYWPLIGHSKISVKLKTGV